MTPGKPTEEMLNLVAKACNTHKVDQKLLRAIITVESAWDPKALRFEPLNRYVLEAPTYARIHHISIKSEAALQSFSWGLCQIMGSTARGEGYVDHLLDLIDIETNLNWGCSYLAKLVKRFHDQDDIISAYNQGYPKTDEDGKYLNQGYVDKVKAAMVGF